MWIVNSRKTVPLSSWSSSSKGDSYLFKPMSVLCLCLVSKAKKILSEIGEANAEIILESSFATSCSDL